MNFFSMLWNLLICINFIIHLCISVYLHDYTARFFYGCNYLLFSLLHRFILVKLADIRKEVQCPICLGMIICQKPILVINNWTFIHSTAANYFMKFCSTMFSVLWFVQWLVIIQFFINIDNLLKLNPSFI